jgi:hypothetical protein
MGGLENHEACHVFLPGICCRIFFSAKDSPISRRCACLNANSPKNDRPVSIALKPTSSKRRDGRDFGFSEADIFSTQIAHDEL